MDETNQQEASNENSYLGGREQDMDADDLGIAGLEDPVVIGRGGFATVLRAYQPAFRRTVAVKLLSVVEVDELTRERFERECQAMGLLSEHPSIVTVLDAGFNHDGRPYLVMAYMPEGSLQDRLHADGAMGWQTACQISIKIAAALQASHDAGILHRDVKPANVLISQYGEPQLSDFGIARITGGHETSSGVITASLAYAAPETIEGQRPHAPSDLYSLAAMTYALTAGRPPHGTGDASSVGALIRAILNDAPPELAGAPPDFVEVVTKGLSKRPHDRFDSALAFGEALRAVQAHHGVQQTELALLRVPAAPVAAAPGRSERHVTQDIDDVRAGSTGAPGETKDTDAATAHAGPTTTATSRPAVDSGDAPLGTTERPETAKMATAPAEPPAEPAVPRRRRRLPWTLAAALVVVVAVVGIVVATRDDGSGLPRVDAAELPPADTTEVDTSGIVTAEVPESVFATGDPAAVRAAFCSNRPGIDLSNRDLSDLDITNRSMLCADLSGSNLDGADLGGSDFTGADFTGASLIGASASSPVQFDYVWFVGADLTDFNGSGGVDLVSADATGAVLTGVDLGPNPNLADAIGFDQFTGGA